MDTGQEQQWQAPPPSSPHLCRVCLQGQGTPVPSPCSFCVFWQVRVSFFRARWPSLRLTLRSLPTSMKAGQDWPEER